MVRTKWPRFFLICHAVHADAASRAGRYSTGTGDRRAGRGFSPPPPPPPPRAGGKGGFPPTHPVGGCPPLLRPPPPAGGGAGLSPRRRPPPSGGRGKALFPGIQPVGADPQLFGDHFRGLAAGQPVINGFAFERFIEFTAGLNGCLCHGLVGSLSTQSSVRQFEATRLRAWRIFSYCSRLGVFRPSSQFDTAPP